MLKYSSDITSACIVEVQDDNIPRKLFKNTKYKKILLHTLISLIFVQLLIFNLK